MARGPFQGTFTPNARPTVVTAPDAIVYINGETDIIGCPNCKRRFDFGKYITSIQTNLDVDSVPGSATIAMSIPRHVVDDFYQDGVPVISPMMEVEIFAKGYYNLEGVPQYYPIFWGIITEVGDSYSGGEHTVSLSCADILKWWEICRMNVNPAFTAPSPQLGRSIFGNILFGTNPYDMIFSLTQMAFGDVILGTGSLVSLVKESGQKATFNAAMGDIMQYWQSRFSRIRSNLLLYGVNGVAVRGDSVAHSYETGKFTPSKGASPIANAVRNANGGKDSAQLSFDPSDPDVTAFRTQFSQAGEVNFWQSEYQTKLEIANACKEAVGFEFYMDSTGDIVFKPPFYNLDIISNKPVSWIQDIDVINWDFSESESEVVTQLSIQGAYGGNVDYGFGPEITPFTSVTDYHLLRQYGWRPHTYNSEFMGDLNRMFYHGMDILDRLNSRRHQGTVNIPMRPELRLGFPVYLAPKDQIWYIKGISHSIAFGGQATTTVTLTARRQKFCAIQGISTLKTMSASGTHDKNYIDALASHYLSKGKKGKSPAKEPFKGKEGPPTIRQLRDRAFELQVGDAATIPPTGLDPANPASMDPYKPLILRHPKTGKIVGYPNVVMVYTRPYDSTAAYAEHNKGQKSPGQNTNIQKASKAQVQKRQEEAQRGIDSTIAQDRTQELQNKYSNNRYSYGLNSAGVYVYAHDVDKVITQLALIPSKNIAVTGDSSFTIHGKTKLTNPTSMVRPVSDERGFEVIGHYRYGRGVSLRDGSLIYNEKENNKKVEPTAQVALSGNVLSTLTAQSQGLTTAITNYPNTADTVSRMIPEDLQTAGTWAKGADGSTTNQFNSVGEDGKNFVSSAPLGSAEEKGVPVSVEAGQLSRALTLAEMTVRSDLVPGNANCACQTGRADLYFINAGYKIKGSSVGTSAPDNSTLPTSSTTVPSTLTEEEANIAEINAASSLGDIAAIESGALTNQTGSSSAGSMGAPVLPKSLSSQQVTEMVDNYLWRLYSTLDEPHQQHEKALRGGASDTTDNDVQSLPDLFTGVEDATQGEFGAPFNAANRATLGDPEAIALQGSSALSNLKKSFSDFSKNKKEAKVRASNTTRIAQLNGEISRLEKRLSDITPTPGTVRVTGTDNAEDLKKQIAKDQAEIDHLEAELAMLGSE